jgi:hypothetical protein
MSDTIQMQNSLCSTALAAEESGRPEEAARLYRQAIACDDTNPTPYLFLGFVLQKLDQSDAAVQVWSLAADLDSRIVNTWRNPDVPADIQQRSSAADRAIRSHLTAMHSSCVAEYQGQHPQANVERVAAATWCQTHDVAFEYQHPRQKPQLFFVPDLEPIPVYGPGHMPWQAELEAAFEDIREEFLANWEEARNEERPYLEPGAAALGENWKPLADSLNWGSLHLYKQGVANPRLVDLFPTTLEALHAVPLVDTPNGPSEILFSVLQGEQRIPPHYGVANTAVTVHMPIIATDRSAIRVADDDFKWQQGKVFAFDDSFEHESWNESAEPRVNLLFETWHPDLTDDEKGAITMAFATRKNWSDSRSI